jgi:hypothetical protein
LSGAFHYKKLAEKLIEDFKEEENKDLEDYVKKTLWEKYRDLDKKTRKDSIALSIGAFYKFFWNLVEDDRLINNSLWHLNVQNKLQHLDVHKVK